MKKTDDDDFFSFDAEMQSIAHRFEAFIDTLEESFFEEEDLIHLFEYYGMKNNWNRAEQVADYGLKQNPYSADFYVKKAQVAMATQNLPSAFDFLEQAEVFEPSSYEIYVARATAYEMSDDFELATENLFHALTLADEDGKEMVYSALASTYIAKENYEQAIVYCKKALELNPSNGEIINDLCFCYIELEDAPAGIQYFGQMADENPRNDMAWFCLGSLYNFANEPHKALEAFDFSLVIIDTNPFAWYYKGNAYLNLEQPEDALPCFEQAVNLDKTHYMFFCSVGVCYEKMEMPDKARPFYKKTTKMAPEAPDGWFGLAICDLMEEEYETAIKNLMKAISIENTNPDYWYNLGDAYYQINNNLEATNAFNRALEIAPNHMEARIDLAFMMSENDAVRLAIKLFEAGMEFHAENAEYMYCYAAQLVEIGFEQEGLNNLQIALSLDYNQHDILEDVSPIMMKNPKVLQLIAQYKENS